MLKFEDFYSKYRSRLPVSFDNSMDLYESFVAIVEYFNNIIKNNNVMVDFIKLSKKEQDKIIADMRNELDDFLKRFDNELNQEVIIVLKDWQKSGLLDVVINEALQTQMDILEEETNVKLNDFASQLSQKATYTELETAIAAVADGGPSIVQNTFNDLVQNYPNGANGTALVLETDPAHVYVWYQDSWTNAGVYQGIELKDDTVTTRNVQFIKKSSNLLNINKLKNNTSFDNATGEEVSSSGYGLIDEFIPVQRNTVYYSSGLLKIGRFDEKLNFINAQNSPSSFNSNNASYIKAVANSWQYDSARINRGELKPYEPYYKQLDTEINVPSSSIKLGTEKIIRPENVTFVETSSNLYNEKEVRDNTNINSGGVAVTAPYESSGYIPVLPYSKYIINNGFKQTYFDGEKTFISQTQGIASPNNPSVITAPNKAGYVVITGDRNTGIKKQMNEGEELLPYEPYYKKLSGVTFEPEQTFREFIDDDRFVYFGKTDGLYTSPVIEPVNVQSLTAQDQVDAFDELLSRFPDYITRKTEDTDEDGNPIYSYTFKKTAVPNDNYKTKPLKMFLVAGLHGFEKGAWWSFYHSMKQLCERWEEDELLGTLRNNIEIITIPILNRYSADNNVRKNGNGVDIARNFEPNFTVGNDPNSDTYGGTRPLSEPQSQVVDKILKENKDDLVLFASMHNFWNTENNPYDVIWPWAATRLQNNVGKSVVTALSHKWKKEYNFFPQDSTTYLGKSDRNAMPASESQQAAMYGIQAVTFETAQNIPGNPNGGVWDSTVIKLGVESQLNFIIQALTHNVNYYNSR